MKRVFNFVVRYFGFLKHIPLLPHLFDALLKIGLVVSNRNILDYLDEIESEVLSWEKTSAHIHKFGGIQFNVHNKEIGHIHSNGLLDILFSKEIKKQLVEEGRVKEHHVFKNSGWVSFYIRTPEDKILAIELLRLSYKKISNGLLQCDEGTTEITTTGDCVLSSLTSPNQMIVQSIQPQRR